MGQDPGSKLDCMCCRLSLHHDVLGPFLAGWRVAGSFAFAFAFGIRQSVSNLDCTAFLTGSSQTSSPPLILRDFHLGQSDLFRRV